LVIFPGGGSKFVGFNRPLVISLGLFPSLEPKFLAKRLPGNPRGIKSHQIVKFEHFHLDGLDTYQSFSL